VDPQDDAKACGRAWAKGAHRDQPHDGGAVAQGAALLVESQCQESGNAALSRAKSAVRTHRRPASSLRAGAPADHQRGHIPYGIYDLANNQGAVFVGTSVDTPAFAVDSIERWWCLHGRLEYPEANTLVILADSGGSNGCAPRAWKVNLQEKLCNQHGLTVTVSHYPSGASKWNPIEHRLFSEISKHWAGQPLESYATILNYIRRTRTTTGLTARAYLVRKKYQRGVKISNGQMCLLSLRRNKTLPKWNYTLSP
jgi:hypothetical protein